MGRADRAERRGEDVTAPRGGGAAAVRGHRPARRRPTRRARTPGAGAAARARSPGAAHAALADGRRVRADGPHAVPPPART